MESENKKIEQPKSIEQLLEENVKMLQEKIVKLTNETQQSIGAMSFAQYMLSEMKKIDKKDEYTKGNE
jgi:hypothetical protein